MSNETKFTAGPWNPPQWGKRFDVTAKNSEGNFVSVLKWGGSSEDLANA